MRVSNNIQISSVGLGNTKHENVQLTQYKMISTKGRTPATHKIQILYLNLVFIKFIQNTSLIIIIIIINWRVFEENIILNVAILAQWDSTPFLWVMCWSWCEQWFDYWWHGTLNDCHLLFYLMPAELFACLFWEMIL